MSKEDFRKRVFEEKLFKELKDKPLRNADTIRRKTEGYDIDFTRLYTKLVNYQVETYGEQLQTNVDIESWIEKTRLNAKVRKNKNRRYWGIK